MNRNPREILFALTHTRHELKGTKAEQYLAAVQGENVQAAPEVWYPDDTSMLEPAQHLDPDQPEPAEYKDYAQPKGQTALHSDLEYIERHD